jgi:putative endonuclease
MKRRETGILGEKLAKDFLINQGYIIKDTNYRCREGEIDLIALHKDCLVFIEVRTKRSYEYGSPEESITNTKKARLLATAYHYQQNHNELPSSWRIDVLAIELNRSGQVNRIDIIENAVNET